MSTTARSAVRSSVRILIAAATALVTAPCKNSQAAPSVSLKGTCPEKIVIQTDWYATPDHVSTWLYEAVHISGPVRRLPIEGNRGHGDVLLSTFEERLMPKQPWSLSTMEENKRETMLQSIVLLEMDVKQVEGQRKLNQHKSDEDYASITRHLSRSDDADAREIAGKLKSLRPHLKY